MARGVVSGMGVVIQVTAPTAEVCMSIHQPLNCRHSTGAIDGCAYSVDATIFMRSFYDCAFHVISNRCIYRLDDGVYTAQAERANVRFGRVA